MITNLPIIPLFLLLKPISSWRIKDYISLYACVVLRTEHLLVSSCLPKPYSCSLSLFVPLAHKCFFSQARAPLGNRSEPLDIHLSLSDRCLPISLTLLGSYCELPDCVNAPLRTEPGSQSSAWLPYRLVTDGTAGRSHVLSQTPVRCSQVLHYGWFENLERLVIKAIKMTTAAACVMPLLVADGGCWNWSKQQPMEQCN